jgi:hypothetical protein
MFRPNIDVPTEEYIDVLRKACPSELRGVEPIIFCYHEERDDQSFFNERAVHLHSTETLESIEATTQFVLGVLSREHVAASQSRRIESLSEDCGVQRGTVMKRQHGVEGMTRE